jgi:hypothetical protein
VDVVDVRFAQDVVEAFHSRRREQAVQNDVLELSMQSGIQPAQIRSGADAQRMAARAFFDEFDLAG